jgi:Peptidase C13 family
LRYAILYSGATQRRNLNGLEFCYRTLVDRCGFEAGNIQVLNHDASLRTADVGPTDDPAGAVWPGDATAYRLKVTGQGNREAFRAALDTLKHQLTADDLLFVHTTGHGGDYADGRGPFLLAYPRRERYRMHDFCSDLADLPAHGALLVLMAQCFSTGFAPSIAAASRSQLTFIAAASGGNSYAMRGDRNWNSFERNWLAALSGHDVDGASLPKQASDCGPTSVSEAFNYANRPEIRDSRESPECLSNSSAAERMTLTIDALR